MIIPPSANAPRCFIHKTQGNWLPAKIIQVGPEPRSYLCTMVTGKVFLYYIYSGWGSINSLHNSVLVIVTNHNLLNKAIIKLSDLKKLRISNNVYGNLWSASLLYSGSTNWLYTHDSTYSHSKESSNNTDIIRWKDIYILEAY